MSLIGSIAAQSAGDRIVYGTIALDGSNPTSVVIPKADPGERIKAAFAGLNKATAPGDGTALVTWAYAAMQLDLYGWMNTGGTDPTLVASTGTETVEYIVVVGR